MSTKRAIFALVAPALIAFAITLTPSAAQSAPSRSTGTPAVAIVLFDLSQSTQTANIRAAYLNGFEMVLEYVAKHGGLVFGDVIDDDPLAHASLPIRVGFAGKHFPTNPLTYKRSADRTVTAALQLASHLLQQRTGRKGTAVLDAINLAANVLNTYRSAEHRYLIVFSDGIEESSRYRFTRANLKPAVIRHFIAAERHYGFLPNLSGVQAYFAGAGATAGMQTESRAWKVRRFWITYLNATGANIDPIHYGPTLISFP